VSPGRTSGGGGPAAGADAQRGGMPGDGAGRREEPGDTGVYPFSEAPADEADAPVRTGAEWGQGEAGPGGYEDSGSSEIIPPNQER